MIELQESVTIERHDSEGWGKHHEFQSVWVQPTHIESMKLVGLTRIVMISGDIIDVKETPDEILYLWFGDKIGVPSYKQLVKEKDHDSNN